MDFKIKIPNLAKILKNRTHLIAKIFAVIIIIINSFTIAISRHAPLILMPLQLPALARVTTIRGILPLLVPVREGKYRVPKLVSRDAIATSLVSPLP